MGPTLSPHSDESRVVTVGVGEEGDAIDGFDTDITTIAQARYEHARDYVDVETLLGDLPIEQLTFAAHDDLTPY